MTKKLLLTLVLSFLYLATPGIADDHDGEHPGKEVDPKAALKHLKHYIQEDSKLKGGFFVFDRKTKRIRNLRLKKIHKLRDVEGRFYTCADFVDTNKDAVDLDFYFTRNLDSNDETAHAHWNIYKIKVHKINQKPRYTPPTF